MFATGISQSWRSAEQINSAMLRVYNHMALAVAVSAIVAGLVASSPAAMAFLYTGIMQWVVLFAPLALVFFLGFRITRMSVAAAQATFWTYATGGVAFQNFGIVLGLVLLGAMVVPTVVGLRRGRADAAALAVAGALGASLFVNGAAFGLFKVLMFAQPFLWAAVAGWVVSRRSVAAFAVAGMVLCGVAGLNARRYLLRLLQPKSLERR